MREWTGDEIRAARDALETEAARLLGQMLLEFSRLDMKLGLCLVWVDAGAKLESLTNKVAEYNFHKKLEELSVQIDKKLPHGSKRRLAYEAWVVRAHEARQRRNELVHGRWGVDAINNKVVNVLGMPTSAEQRSVKYTLEDLAAVNDELRQLQTELQVLATDGDFKANAMHIRSSATSVQPVSRPILSLGNGSFRPKNGRR